MENQSEDLTIVESTNPIGDVGPSKGNQHQPNVFITMDKLWRKQEEAFILL